MLVRLNYVVRLVRCGLARRLRRPGGRDLLFAEGAMESVLRARRAVGVAALVGAAGWVLLADAMAHRPVVQAPGAVPPPPVPAQQQVIPVCRPLLASAG